MKSSKDKVNKSLKHIGGEQLSRFIRFATRFSRLSRIYGQIGDKRGLVFIDDLFGILNVNYKFDESDLKKIPASGAFIIVANHPFGGLEGILLIKLLSCLRPDIKVVVKSVIKELEPINEFFIEQGGFEQGGLHLESGGGLCIFPAGEVSGYEGYKITDKLWQYSVLKFIKKSKVPVFPVYFGGHNSYLFHMMNQIHPSLSTVRLPSEFTNKKKKPVKVRIGAVIPVEEQNDFPEIYQFGRYLRAKTYSLDTRLEVQRFFKYSRLYRQLKPTKKSVSVSKEEIVEEVKKLNSECLLFQHTDENSGMKYSVYCAPASTLLYTLQEIGHLRAFFVGKDERQNSELDEFDLYYQQLFIWDEDANRIVSGCRVGRGADIYYDFGKQGFYMQSFFRMSQGFEPYLSQSLAVNNFYVIKGYQQKNGYDLLWEGILQLFMKNPEYRYLLGPIRISNDYSRFSKDVIIRFIMANHFDWNIGRYIKPRKAFKFKSHDANLNVIMESMDDIGKLDKFIGDVDELHRGLPVLLNRCLSLNAKIIGFNVHPINHNSLDGLLLLDVNDIPTI